MFSSSRLVSLFLSCVCAHWHRQVFWHRGKTSVWSPITEIMNLKKTHKFQLNILFFWLNNVIFVEHIKLRIPFKIFILCPLFSTLEHSCLGQQHHQLPHSYAPSVFTACLHCGYLFTHFFCIISQEKMLCYKCIILLYVSCIY